jgi:protein-tyrosine phosphatase
LPQAETQNLPPSNPSFFYPHHNIMSANSSANSSDASRSITPNPDGAEDHYNSWLHSIHDKELSSAQPRESSSSTTNDSPSQQPNNANNLALSPTLRSKSPFLSEKSPVPLSFSSSLPSNTRMNQQRPSSLNSPTNPALANHNNVPDLSPTLSRTLSSSALKNNLLRRESSYSNLSAVANNSNSSNANSILSGLLSAAPAQSLLPPNLYVQQRAGSLLARSMIMKSDHFPFNIENSNLELHIIGAPNFQQIRPFRVFAVGQPSVSGVRTVLNLLHCKNNKSKRVVWMNLREEPVIYLNNRPFVLREIDFPYHNMSDFSGIDAQRLAAIESRLKADILAEGENNYYNILVHDEHIVNEIRPCWESVDTSTVKTNIEMSNQLQAEGYNVVLVRVPVTAESVFEANQFDSITQAFAEASHLYDSQQIETNFLFNCQMGRGRSAVGMVLVVLLQSHKLCSPVSSFLSPNNSWNKENKPEYATDGLLAYRRGEFDIILKLVRMLSNGKLAKANVDSAIDMCGRVHHIREVILESFLKSEHARAESTHKTYSSSTAAYMKRYFFLICFSCWLLELPSKSISSDYLQSEHSFASWMTAHPELVKLADTLIQEESLIELLPAPESKLEEQKDASSAAVAPAVATEECSPLDQFVFSRSGAVLSKRTIVKSEFFRAQDTLQRAQLIAGLPNYRHLQDIPISGTAQPNYAGIKMILDSLKEEFLQQASNPSSGGLNLSENNAEFNNNRTMIKTSSYTDVHNHTFTITSRTTQEINSKVSDFEQSQVIWINLREEPVIFIQDSPYLLREYSHPFRVLSEFNTGMTPQRSEQIEKGFKKDILKEWRANKGKLLLHEENIYRQIKAKWEEVESSSKILTMREIFELQLKEEGYTNIQYHRVPLHVEEVPGLKSFDRLFELLSAQNLVAEHTNVVFNCQKGGRRSTMGMIVTCLLMMHQGSLDFKIADTDYTEDSANNSPRNKLRPLIEEEEEEKPGVVDAVIDSVITNDILHNDASKVALSAPVRDSSNGVLSNAAAPAVIASGLKRSPSAVSITIADSSTSVAAGNSKELHNVAIETRARYGGGDYKGILSLIRILKYGKKVKEEVDIAVDLCGSVHNIRNSIAEARNKANLDRTGDRQKNLMFKALKYLESYAYLICFNAYLHDRKEQYEEHLAAVNKTQALSPPAALDTLTTPNASGSLNIPTPSSINSGGGHTRMDSELSPDALGIAGFSNYNQFNPYLEENESKQGKRVEFDEENTAGNEITPSATTSNSSPTLAAARPPRSGRDSLSVLSMDDTFSFPSFSAWIQSRPELRLLLEHLRHDPEDSLKSNQTMSGDEFSAVYEARNGNVLVRGSILKSDYFAGVINKNIEQIIEGAINFRPIESFPVAGTGIPTVQGITNILSFYTNIHAENVKWRPLFRAGALLWLNLREEPLLYVNNRPFVLRDSDTPYVNIENTGITARRIEAQEKTLQRDALVELRRSGGDRILLHDEDENGNLYGYWEICSPDAIKTPKEQFYTCFKAATDRLKGEKQPFNFTGRYYRTPITDEQAPSPHTLDEFVRYLEQGVAIEHRTLILNCQMGRGRTTTGLIIACLWCWHRGKVDANIFLANRTKSPVAATSSNYTTPLEQIEAVHVPAALSPNSNREESHSNSLKAGWYKIVISLVRVLPDGAAMKRETDAVIDWCSGMQNLRQVVYDAQVAALSCLPRKKAFFVRRGTNYLIRYFMLILINSYFHSEKSNNFSKSFVQWLNERKEIVNILEKVEFPEILAEAKK